MVSWYLLILVFFVQMVQAQSFLRVRPPYWSSWPERLAMTRYRFEDPYDAVNRSTFSMCLLGGVSIDSERIARYFLPFNKSSLLCGELGSIAAQQQNADLIASYFGVLTGLPPQPGTSITDPNYIDAYTFQSRLHFSPQYSFAGLGMCYHLHLSEDLYKGWWFEISSPLLFVKTTMGMKEYIITAGGPNGNDPLPLPTTTQPKYVRNMTEAFNLSTWSYGKIGCPQSKVGLADIELKTGYIIKSCEDIYWASYWGLYIPTGTMPTNEYVFEPVIGYNGHWGMFMGGQYGFKFWQGACGSHMSAEIETVGKYFFDNYQERLFDLYSAEWSRYLWVYQNPQAAYTSPGVNFFSRLAKIKPGTTRDLNIAWVYRNYCWTVDIGYHYFAAEAESCELENVSTQPTGVAGIWDSALQFSGGGMTRDFSQINNYQGILNDSIADLDSFVALNAQRFDLTSSVTPAAVTHTNYITVGYTFRKARVPATLSAGASLEYGKSPQELDRVTVYGRYLLEF